MCCMDAYAAAVHLLEQLQGLGLSLEHSDPRFPTKLGRAEVLGLRV